MTTYLSLLTPEFWASFWNSFFIMVAAVIVAAVPTFTIIVQAKIKRNEDAEARKLEQKSRDDLHAEVKSVSTKVDDVKEEGGNREARLTDKIEENTTITTNLKTQIDDIKKQRAATVLARKDGTPAYYKIPLPGVDYEKFHWATGELVEWKSEYCEIGRQVRYLVHGPCEMGFHFHEVAEILFGVVGTLIFEVNDHTLEIGAGETFTAEADAVHAARFEKSSVFPGEIVVHWPDLNSNILEVGVYLQ